MLLLSKNEMESKSIEPWTNLVNNASKAYRDYFKFEEKYLEEHLIKDGVCIDVGCGDGRTLETIAKYSNYVIGIDNDENAITLAEKNTRHLNNVYVYNMDAENLLAFLFLKADNIFIGGFTFCNFGDTRKKILQVISRKMRNTGNLIFSVYNENALEERLNMYKSIFNDTYVLNSQTGLVVVNNGKIFSEQFNQKRLEKILKNNEFKINDIQKGKIFYMVNCSKKL